MVVQRRIDHQGGVAISEPQFCCLLLASCALCLCGEIPPLCSARCDRRKSSRAPGAGNGCAERINHQGGAAISEPQFCCLLLASCALCHCGEIPPLCSARCDRRKSSRVPGAGNGCAERIDHQGGAAISEPQ